MIFRPNIIWIVTTQWRHCALGFKGDVNALTPKLDNFAKVATDYTQAVTPHPMGPQARASLLTGKRSPHSGINDYWDSLPADRRTIAHALRDRGYVTGFLGKWHLGQKAKSHSFVGKDAAKTIIPEHARGGFDFWEGFESGFLLNDPWLHGTQISQPMLFEGYQPEILIQRALEWMGTNASTPFFCVVSLESPHPPYAASALGVSPTEPSKIVLRGNVPLGGDIEKRSRTELSGYYAHIEATDRCIGRLVAQTDLTNTIVVFTSVHGDMHGSHGVFRKAWPYEESVRIPFLVSNLRSTSGGFRRDESPISLSDLPEMSIAWAEGREWHCRGDHALISMPVPMTIPLQCDRAWRGIRSSHHKLILNDDSTPWMYFDLENDPLELENLVGDSSFAAEIEKARQLL